MPTERQIEQDVDVPVRPHPGYVAPGAPVPVPEPSKPKRRPTPPAPKKKPKRYGTGDVSEPGLHQADRHGDIRAIYFKFFSGMVTRAGLEHEDVFQEICIGFINRDRGSSGFDPARSSWGHYAYLVTKSILYNLLKREGRRHAFHYGYEHLSPTDEIEVDGFPAHVVEAAPVFNPIQYVELETELKDFAWEFGGDRALDYVTCKLRGDPIPAKRFTPLREHLREFFAEV